MALILQNSRDINNKFLFGHFMMRPKWNDTGRKIEGPCYGRVNAWCSDENKSYESKLSKELDYMEQVGCNGYMIELCAYSSTNEPYRWKNSIYTKSWLNEVEEKYNMFLDLIKKHKKMWGLVSVFNDNAWQRDVGPDSSTTDKIIDLVAKAGHKDMICILPVGEPTSSFGISTIPKVHEKLSNFKILKECYGDSSTNYWNWYSSDGLSGTNKKLFESSDGGTKIQELAGYGEYSWVPEFPKLSGHAGAEKISYDYRGSPKRSPAWVRECMLHKNTISGIYYAWGYDGNIDGTEEGDRQCKNGIDVYAICGDVVGHNLNIPANQMEQKTKDLVLENGGEVTLF